MDLISLKIWSIGDSDNHEQRINVFVFSSSMFSLLALVKNFDAKQPLSTRLTNKFRVKDNSIFRRIIRFKDKENASCNYFKIIPFYVFLLLAFLSLLAFLIDVLTKGLISSVLPEKIMIIIDLYLTGISALYLVVIVTWWEIDGYIEIKQGKDYSEDIKRIRKILKDNVDNKRRNKDSKNSNE